MLSALKKLYGLNVYLLPLDLPTPLPQPVTFPAPRPSLPTLGLDSVWPSNDNENVDCQAAAIETCVTSIVFMSETDIGEITRFLREFVMTCLIPWMEGRVSDWNELVSGIDCCCSGFITSALVQLKSTSAISLILYYKTLFWLFL